MLLVRPSSIPTFIWHVVPESTLRGWDTEEGNAVAFDDLDELIVFLKAVRPKRVVVHGDEDVFRRIAMAFTPDKVIRAH
ncbi:MAG: hypothetical protein GXN93_04340 [Candidatus Diapherotrites archaeon]|nr:hypothetical protein [Candidatus Diapherotrites archaeon]